MFCQVKKIDGMPRRWAAQGKPRRQVVRLLVHVQHVGPDAIQFAAEGGVEVQMEAAVEAHGAMRSV